MTLLLARLGALLSGMLVSIAVAVGLTRGVGLVIPPKRPASRFRPSLPGLSDAEAASRKTDFFAQERTQLQKKRRKQIIRTAVFSVFNLTMLVLAFSQFWLDDFWGAMGTLGVLAFNILLIVFQQGFAQRQVGRLVGQPGYISAAVIREGRIRSLDLEEVVVGDLLAAGKGDEILAEGVLLGNKRLEFKQPGAEKKPCLVQPGEILTPGSVLLAGEALYEVRKLPSILPDQDDSQLKTMKTPSPLESLLLKILYVMLVFAGLFYLLLLLRLVRVEVLSPELMTFYRDTMSTIFSLVPAGFFLMILVNYAMGSIDMAKQGFLVRDNRTIESIAQLNTLFLISNKMLLDVEVSLEMFPGIEASNLDENLTRRILGDLAHSTSSRDVYLEVLADAFSGEKRPLLEEAFFFSLYGWGAVTLKEPDLRGTYVLGYPRTLKPYLAEQKSKPAPVEIVPEQPKPSRMAGVRKRLSRMFHRKGKPEVEESAMQVASATEVQSATEIQSATEVQSATQTAPAKVPAVPFSVKLKKNLERFSSQIEIIQGIPIPVQGSQEDLLGLVLAYLPEPTSIYQPDAGLGVDPGMPGIGIPTCPSGLIPVCHLSFKKQVRPAVQEIIQRFRREGVAFKLMTNFPREQVLSSLQKLGILPEDLSGFSHLSGEEVERAGDGQVVSATLITDANPGQMVDVIAAYHRQNQRIGLVGSDFNFWEPMRQADVSIAEKGSHQALMARANIILVKKSLAPLNPLLERGQQIVNGTLDVMRLNLVQIFYTLCLLLTTFFLNQRMFPFSASQGGMIAFFTVVLPTAVMSFWAPKGRVNQGRFGRVLARFIFAPVLWITPAVILLFSYFDSIYGSDYARHVSTHALVCMGTLVAVYARPPWGWLTAGRPVAVDRRPLAGIGLSILVFNLLVWIPLAQKYLSIAPLNSLADYGLVWLVSLAAGVLIQLTWRIFK